VLILKALGWLLMADVTPYSHQFVAEMWPRTLDRNTSRSLRKRLESCFALLYIPSCPGAWRGIKRTSPLTRIPTQRRFRVKVSLGTVAPK